MQITEIRYNNMYNLDVLVLRVYVPISDYAFLNKKIIMQAFSTTTFKAYVCTCTLNILSFGVQTRECKETPIEFYRTFPNHLSKRANFPIFIAQFPSDKLVELHIAIYQHLQRTNSANCTLHHNNFKSQITVCAM